MNDITSIWLPTNIRLRGVAPDDMRAAAAGQDLSLLFQGWGVRLDTKTTPNVGATALEIVAPCMLGAKDRLIGFSVIVRGHSVVSRGGSISVVGTAGDSRDELRLMYGDIISDDLLSKDMLLSWVTASEALRPSKRRNTLKITLAFYAERLDANNVAAVTLDSIDVDALVVPVVPPARRRRTRHH